MRLSKYTIDCFTPKSAGTLYPENTYHAEDADQVAEIIKDCTRKVAGISLVEVYINIKEDECLDCEGKGLVSGKLCDTCQGEGLLNIKG